jgi:hypothetical protein
MSASRSASTTTVTIAEAIIGRRPSFPPVITSRRYLPRPPAIDNPIAAKSRRANCSMVAARPGGRGRARAPCGRGRRSGSATRMGEGDGRAATPHPKARAESPSLPSPARGEGTITRAVLFEAVALGGCHARIRCAGTVTPARRGGRSRARAPCGRGRLGSSATRMGEGDGRAASCDDAVRGALTESVTGRRLVVVQSVRADFWRTDHPAA